jgi:hypothetical protein
VTDHATTPHPTPRPRFARVLVVLMMAASLAACVSGSSSDPLASDEFQRWWRNATLPERQEFLDALEQELRLEQLMTPPPSRRCWSVATPVEGVGTWTTPVEGVGTFTTTSCE